MSFGRKGKELVYLGKFDHSRASEQSFGKWFMAGNPGIHLW